MQAKRNPQATCGSCPHRWTGKERIMTGVDDIVSGSFSKCTKDRCFTPVREDQFCEAHPEFWLGNQVGMKGDA